jgi:acetyl esterase/lipase
MAVGSRWVIPVLAKLMEGSTAFYLEFLMSIIKFIPGHQARIFSLEYPLVPTSIYPSQLSQIAKAYEYLLTITSAENIIFAGDSAGAALHLSFLLHANKPCPDIPLSRSLPTPKGLILLSPWCHIDSKHDSPSRSLRSIDEDFLSTGMLNQYARLYSGASPPKESSILLPIHFWWEASKRFYRQLWMREYSTQWITLAKSAIEESYLDTGELTRHLEKCKSPYINPFAALKYEEWLAQSLPLNCLIVYGAKEIMAGDIFEFAEGLERVSRGSVEVHSRWKKGWHVWPLVLMYLGRDTSETESGVRLIADFIMRTTGLPSLAETEKTEKGYLVN